MKTLTGIAALILGLSIGLTSPTMSNEHPPDPASPDPVAADPASPPDAASPDTNGPKKPRKCRRIAAKNFDPFPFGAPGTATDPRVERIVVKRCPGRGVVIKRKYIY